MPSLATAERAQFRRLDAERASIQTISLPVHSHLDNAIDSSEEAEESYGEPVLGVIPTEKLEKGEKRRLTIFQNRGTPAAEACRALRNSLDFCNVVHNIKTLVVMSAAPAEGKSTVVVNLAVGLAEGGKRVAFVNCDFLRPTTDQFYAVTNSIGLPAVPAGRDNTRKAALPQPMANVNLLVLTPRKLSRPISPSSSVPGRWRIS